MVDALTGVETYIAFDVAVRAANHGSDGTADLWDQFGNFRRGGRIDATCPEPGRDDQLQYCAEATRHLCIDASTARLAIAMPSLSKCCANCCVWHLVSSAVQDHPRIARQVQVCST